MHNRHPSCYQPSVRQNSCNLYRVLVTWTWRFSALRLLVTQKKTRVNASVTWPFSEGAVLNSSQIHQSKKLNSHGIEYAYCLKLNKVGNRMWKIVARYQWSWHFLPCPTHSTLHYLSGLLLRSTVFSAPAQFVVTKSLGKLDSWRSALSRGNTASLNMIVFVFYPVSRNLELWI